MAENDNKPKETEKKFERDQLIADSGTLLGTPSHIVTGALADKAGDKPVTLKEAEAAVDRFLKREVKEQN